MIYTNLRLLQFINKLLQFAMIYTNFVNLPQVKNHCTSLIQEKEKH